MNDPSTLPEVARQAIAVFRRAASADSDTAISAGWAPGRMNIIGEHTDYNDGFVLPAAIHRLVALAGVSADEPFATLYSAHHQAWARVPLGDDVAFAGEQVPLWARYVQATWRQLAMLGAVPASAGFKAAIVGDVPLGGGLSSSAALEVATAMFAQSLGGRALPPLDVARACQRAEQAGADVAVGIMDQAASCLGRPHSAMLLDCRALTFTYVPIPEDAEWIVFDTGAPHTLATSGYNTRRGECEAAVARLAPVLAHETPGRKVHALRDITLADLMQHSSLLDDVLLKRARHVVSENMRTLAAAEALQKCDLAMVGMYLNQSHASLRDDYEVSCFELDAAVDVALATSGTFGARMMGAGFGGSIIALVRPESSARLCERLISEYPRRTGRNGALVPCALTGEAGIQAASGRP